MQRPVQRLVPPRPLVVAVSGPDGAGKSSLVDAMRTTLREFGYHPVTAHCYGCVLCRRLRTTPSAYRRTSATGGPGRADRLHAVLDAAELALRLAEARLRARVAGRGRTPLVVTDRGPLDALVKFDPAPRSRPAGLFIRLAAGYDSTLLLDAAPEILATRDGEHGAAELAGYRARYRGWARFLPSVMRLDATHQVPLDAALAAALGAQAAPRATAGTASARRHVVISSYDSSANPYYHGGGALVVERVARALAEDFRVTVVTAGRRGGTDTRDGVRYHRLPVGWAGPRLGQLLFHALLPLTARRLPHDLWLESFTPPFSTGFLPLFTRSPVVGVAQMLSGAVMWREYHLPFFLVERLGLRCYRDVVTLNAADRDVVRRYSPAARVRVIPNGVERRDLDRTRLGQGEHILFLGRIDVHVKGLDLLLAAYAAAAPALPLVIAGSGPPAEERRLAALLAAAGGRVHRAGQVDGARKEELLERSAFLVLPSRHESFGIAALEAMSYGKPVLHFDLPCLRWLHGGGVGVPPFDTGALAAQLRRLAGDPELRRRLGGQAYQAAQPHTWQETTERYRSLARDLLGLPAPTTEGFPTCLPTR